jgi:hypothetical protein
VNGTYVGYVQRNDNLYDFLCQVTSDRLGALQTDASFRAFKLSGSNEVYAYEEKHSKSRLICKFFGTSFGWDRDKAATKARQEYESLETLRSYDLVGSPHHVVKPFALNPEINCVLALEYFSGEQFSSAIKRCIANGDCGHLYWRLKSLAYFLATQHNRTIIVAPVDFDSDHRYFGTVVGRLFKQKRIEQCDVDELIWLRDLWRERPRMWEDHQVLLHGDATPANFIFGNGMDVAAIDLERMKRGDRMFDVGRVAGELQHAFMVGTGDRGKAEPFIGHFLWEYSCHFPGRYDTFKSITSRAPYYMAVNLLRIARNDYVDSEYSGRLIAQAKELMRSY